MIPRCLTIAGSDSGGGAGIQADLKAFARLGCWGSTAVVALTAQNTVAVTGITEAPVPFVRAQLDAVFSDIGVDAAKTGMLFSRGIIDAVADFLEEHPVPLVVDPVLVASSGALLMQEDAGRRLIERILPLATIVTPNLREACWLAGLPYAADADRRELAEQIVALGAPAVVVKGGHGVDPIDWLYDGDAHTQIPVERLDSGATHGAGCTHSAALCAYLARGTTLEEAARGASAIAQEAVRNGLADLGAGDGPVDVLGLAAR